MKQVKEKSNSFSFFAYLPPIQSAVMISGDGDLLQCKLNVNLKISPDAVRLIQMTGKKLKVTIEACTELNDAVEKEPKESGRKTDNGRFAHKRNKRAGKEV